MEVIRKFVRLILSKIRSEYALRSETDRILITAFAKGSIRTVYDIGAHKGRWTARMSKLLPKANFILFEANPSHVENLEKLGYQLFISVLTSRDIESIDFFTVDDDAGSTGGSVYKEKTAHYDTVKARRLKASSLNSIVQANRLPQPDFIKIDTQGAELDVIDGAREIFEKCSYILIELPVVEYNDGAPSFDQYNKKLWELGFLPVSISEIHKFGSVIIQMDFLFINIRMIDHTILSGLKLQKS